MSSSLALSSNPQSPRPQPCLALPCIPRSIPLRPAPPIHSRVRRAVPHVSYPCVDDLVSLSSRVSGVSSCVPTSVLSLVSGSRCCFLLDSSCVCIACTTFQIINDYEVSDKGMIACPERGGDDKAFRLGSVWLVVPCNSRHGWCLDFQSYKV